VLPTNAAKHRRREKTPCTQSFILQTFKYVTWKTGKGTAENFKIDFRGIDYENVNKAEVFQDRVRCRASSYNFVKTSYFIA
jgi:hypothetical protein